jgi:hypothetical protein
MMFIVESLMDLQRTDLFDIKLRGNDEEEVTIASCGDVLKDVRKTFQSVNKLNELSKTITDQNDKTEEFLGSVKIKIKI